MYDKLQYISQGETAEKQLYNIRKALDGGCNWIQLRFKNATITEVFDLAESVKILCDVYGAHYIINDDVNLALQIEADGVHLGLNDMPVAEARSILGKKMIIGGTANTLEDVAQRIKEKCNYIGMGPFRLTKTKENLSPIVGIAGYQDVFKKIKKTKIPIYAIGGIELKDIKNLMQTGIYGIAVSNLITKSDDSEELVEKINKRLYADINI
jgi:thiamine-phosphate pyrophosphorylase